VGGDDIGDREPRYFISTDDASVLEEAQVGEGVGGAVVV